MNPARLSILLPAVVYASTAYPAAAVILLNEAIINPPSTDDSREFVEVLRTNPNDSLDGVWLLEIDAEGQATGGVPTGIGEVEHAVDLSNATFVNNLLVVGEGYATSNPYGLTLAQTGLFDLGKQLDDDDDPLTPPETTLQNSPELVLVRDFVGSIGEDLDDDDNGVFDFEEDPMVDDPWSEALDAIAFIDNEGEKFSYFGAAPLLTPNAGATADAFTRFPGLNQPFFGEAWYGGEIGAVNIGGTTNAFYDSGDDLTANTPADDDLNPGEPNAGTAPVTVLGDFNYDGVVNAADYTVWRDALALGSPIVNDNDGVADAGDYTTWKTNFGQPSAPTAVVAPEPGAWLIALSAASSLIYGCRRM
ncbi:MAG: hypothetical protein AAGB00_11935 [Planctomycetota bacterium]